MPPKAKSTTFRQILTDIGKKNFSPVYILMGEEPFYIDKLVDALENSVVSPDEKDFNYSCFYGQDADISEVLAACQQYPFMSDHRLVILKEAQSMQKAKNRLDAFTEYVSHPNESNVFVIAFKNDNLNATSALMKAASKSGAVVFKSPTLRDYEVAKELKAYCTSKHIGIDDRTAEMLVDYLGVSLSKVFSEVDKLIVAGLGKEGRITPELIERNIGLSKDYNNFELQDALAEKNYDKCLRIVKYFESNPKKNPTTVTTGLLFSFYSKLVCAIFSPDKSDSGLMMAMELKSSYGLKNYKTALSRYNANQAVKAIDFLRQFDIQSKGVGSFQNEYALLRELIFNIFTAK